MSQIPVNFPQGMSQSEFERKYATEEDCRQALFAWRWPEGFSCPVCGASRHSLVGTRNIYQCSGCRSQTSLTAGTIFHSTKLPLLTWFRAIYHMTQSGREVSSLALASLLGTTQATAWKISHKLMQVMHEREMQPLSEDDERPEQTGRRGHGLLFLTRIETTGGGLAHRIKFYPVRGLKATARPVNFLPFPYQIRKNGRINMSSAQAGGLSRGVVPVLQAANRKGRGLQPGNFEYALLDAGKVAGGKHMPRYLSSFAYRFNRRFSLPDLFARLAYVALRTPPMPYRLLKLAERGD